MDDFIGVYKNSIPQELCKKLIDTFESFTTAGLTYPRSFEGRSKDDVEDMALGTTVTLSAFSSEEYRPLIGSLWEAYKQYAEKYEIALSARSDPHSVYEVKMQRTLPGQGYHTWHYEASSRAACTRLLTYTIYLNDVLDGGETEFLYYHKRVKPEQGTICIFPGAFTHLHRGNPPLTGPKYIITGWFEL
jgi:hypothetical protein